MPRKPIDYSNTIIYKIVCKDLNVTDVYVGHTTDFTNRKRTHKCGCNCETNKYYNFKVYQFIRANGGWENFKMIEIEKYSCNDANEASSRERYWYEELNATLNSNIPNRSQKEYIKIWYELNKEQIKEYHKEWHKLNYELNKEQIKEYREINKNKIKESDKKYRDKNKEKLKEKQRAYRLQKKCNNQAQQQLINAQLDCNNTDC